MYTKWPVLAEVCALRMLIVVFMPPWSYSLYDDDDGGGGGGDDDDDDADDNEYGD